MSIDLQNHKLPHHFNEEPPRTSNHVPRGQDTPPRALAHILVATRLQATERDAVLLAFRMAATLRTRLTVLHVVAPFAPSSVDLGDAIDNLQRAMSGGSRDWVSAIEQGRADVAAFLKRDVPADILHSVNVDIECRVGDVAQEIARFADNRAVDLVILCDRPSRWRLPLFGSLSQRIERLLSKPIVFGGLRATGQWNGS